MPTVQELITSFSSTSVVSRETQSVGDPSLGESLSTIESTQPSEYGGIHESTKSQTQVSRHHRQQQQRNQQQQQGEYFYDKNDKDDLVDSSSQTLPPKCRSPTTTPARGAKHGANNTTSTPPHKKQQQQAETTTPLTLESVFDDFVDSVFDGLESNSPTRENVEKDENAVGGGDATANTWSTITISKNSWDDRSKEEEIQKNIRKNTNEPRPKSSPSSSPIIFRRKSPASKLDKTSTSFIQKSFRNHRRSLSFDSLQSDEVRNKSKSPDLDQQQQCKRSSSLDSADEVGLNKNNPPSFAVASPTSTKRGMNAASGGSNRSLSNIFKEIHEKQHQMENQQKTQWDLFRSIQLKDGGDDDDDDNDDDGEEDQTKKQTNSNRNNRVFNKTNPFEENTTMQNQQIHRHEHHYQESQQQQQHQSIVTPERVGTIKPTVAAATTKTSSTNPFDDDDSPIQNVHNQTNTLTSTANFPKKPSSNNPFDNDSVSNITNPFEGEAFSDNESSVESAFDYSKEMSITQSSYQQQRRRRRPEQRQLQLEQIQEHAHYYDPTTTAAAVAATNPSSSFSVTSKQDTMATSSTTTSSLHTLHNICSEPTSPQDPIWRQALHILSTDPSLSTQLDPQTPSTKWTPLHIACLSNPPLYMIQALHLANPNAIKQGDSGGRLPLHLLCGSTCGVSVQTLSFLVKEYRESVRKKDDRGFVPLHMMMRNDNIVLSLDILRLLLGQSDEENGGGEDEEEKDERSSVVKMRKGDHLSLQNHEILQSMGRGDVQTITASATGDVVLDDSGEDATMEENVEMKESVLDSMWDDIKKSFYQNKKHKGRGGNDHHGAGGLQRIDLVEHDDEVKSRMKMILAWKRKKEKEEKKNNMYSHGEIDGHEEEEEEDEKNPAAIPAPPHMNLPLHMAIRRSYENVASIDAPPSHHDSFNDEEEDYEDHPTKIATTTNNTLSAMLERRGATQTDVIRVLIRAYPSSLITRNIFGHTPLLTSLLHRETLPTLDLVELLLGIRTAGFNGSHSSISWFSRGNNNFPSFLGTRAGGEEEGEEEEMMQRYITPAMIPSKDTNQLPLHVAASEAVSLSPSILSVIYQSYPAAVHIEDCGIRTPIHCALSNPMGFVPCSEVLGLLLDKRTARMRDENGLLPFHLLVKCASKLPLCIPLEEEVEASYNGFVQEEKGSINYYYDESATHDAETTSMTTETKLRTYRQFFIPDIIKPLPTDPSILQTTSSRRTRLFFNQLRTLPPWLRREACQTVFVQNLLFNEIVSPIQTACILLQGIVLGFTLLNFRLILDEYTAAIGTTTTNITTIDDSSWLLYWYNLPLLFGTTLFLGVTSLYHIMACIQLSVFTSQCLACLWTWTDVGAVVSLSMTVVALGQELWDEEVIGILGTVATALLWLKVVGFLTRYWCGVATFIGGFIKLSQRFLYATIIFAILLVAFAQMFYTLNRSSNDSTLCITNDENTDENISICSMYDSYVIVYRLLLGAPVFGTSQENEQMYEELSIGMVILIIVFTLLVFLLVLYVLVSVAVVDARRLMKGEVLLDMYWVPMLTFVYIVHDLTSCFGRCESDYIANQNIDTGNYNGRSKSRAHHHPSVQSTIYSNMEQTWSLIISSYTNQSMRQTRWWFLNCVTAHIWLLRTVGIIVIPIWLVIGFASLGLLWPPQVRRWFFRPWFVSIPRQDGPSCSKRYDSSHKTAELRREIFQLKSMTYERSVDVQRDIQELKEVIFTLLEEK